MECSRARGLEMHCPAELCELFLNIGKGVGKCAAPVGTGGSFGEDALTLEFERLTEACALGGDGGCLLSFGF